MNDFFRPVFPAAALLTALLICDATPARAQVSTWIGASNATSNWSDSANWQGGALPGGNTDMTFTGSLRTTNTDDFPGISLEFLDFDSTAAAFTLQGNFVQFTHPGETNTITNHSTNLQTLDFNSDMINQVQVTINAISGDIRINNGI